MLFCSSLVAIGDFLKYFGCIKYNFCCCLSCTCCCTEGCSIYAQLIFWIYLFVATMVFVEDAADEGYIMHPFTDSRDPGDYGYSRAVIGAAVEDKCDIDGFLWMDYHIDNIPDVVASRDYEIVSTIGLSFSIIEFVIGIALVHCSKKPKRQKVATEDTNSEDSL